MVREANARVLSSRMRQFTKAILEGRPGGCLNASVGSAVIQYSSSHSIIGSTSKLTNPYHESRAGPVIIIGTHSSSWIAHGRPIAKLVILSIATSTLEASW